ncbi:hypothetical protein NPIL_15491 [Nephila pilipes]|uniref:Uncharacterized protein n=1 Tax=Nephila pilipes TaxID=299642 RepID=A0A8X6PUV3_NEPPI|nr:hypothetical protein NPIL_15491 [Nephila pilipes]
MENSPAKRWEQDNLMLLNEIKNLKSIVAEHNQTLQAFDSTITYLQNKVNQLKTKTSKEKCSKLTSKFYTYIVCSIHILDGV